MVIHRNEAMIQRKEDIPKVRLGLNVLGLKEWRMKEEAVYVATAPSVIVADCGACRMQLQHFTRIPALDPSEILIESLRPKGEKP